MWNISAADWQTPPTPKARKSMVSASHNTRTPTLHAHTHDTHTLTHVCTRVCTHSHDTHSDIRTHITHVHTHDTQTHGDTHSAPRTAYTFMTLTHSQAHTRTHVQTCTPPHCMHTHFMTPTCAHTCTDTRRRRPSGPSPRLSRWVLDALHNFTTSISAVMPGPRRRQWVSFLGSPRLAGDFRYCFHLPWNYPPRPSCRPVDRINLIL